MNRSGRSLSFVPWAFAGPIGVAREDITPPVGIYVRNWGAAVHDTAEGIHSPLTATALALKPNTQDNAPFILLALDLGWWRTREDEWFVRGGLIETLHLDPARVMICLSHTHAGPSICGEDAHRPGGHLVPEYLDHIRQAVIQATRRALSACSPAVLTWNTGRCDLASNRDLPDPERPRIVCGFNPYSTADDTLLVGRVTAEDGTILATLVNYACHPVTLAWTNRLISPDYVGAMRGAVESHTDGAPCLFLQGASGELAPREQYTDDTSIADRNGEQLGFAALSALRGMLPPAVQLNYGGVVESGAPLAAWNRISYSPSDVLQGKYIETPLPLKPGLPSLEEIDRQLQRHLDPVTAERLSRKRRITQMVGSGAEAAMPLWVWRVGDAFLVGQPNEAYSWLQTELRQRIPGHPIAVMNVVNSPCSGYLPPAALYTSDVYQVWQTPFDRNSLEIVLDACQHAIEQLL